MHFTDAKGILTGGKGQYGMNIYRGCSHGCIYCDSRSKCYQFTHAFEDIEVKQNAPDLLEQALNSVLFAFKSKGKPEELKIADELADRLMRAKRALGGCFDRKSAEWAKLNDELRRIFGEKGFQEMDLATLKAHLAEMDELERRLKRLQHEEKMILLKYDHDAKYARLHRYLMQRYPELDKYQQSLVEALNKVRVAMDEMLENDAHLVSNKSYFQEEVSSTIWRTLSFYTTPSLSDAQLDDMALQLFNEYRELMPA